ncbi:MAG: LptF/LptG family permease [Verrucomicrobiales bacterium]|nr:LptF/LptG family permease [Verrucomicrobiales bacterium]
MRTLHTYILKEMLAAIVVAVVVCAGLLLLGNLLKEILSLLMTGQATFGLVVRGISLLLPFVLAFALPMGALTAALLVFGRLSADQELTAARANGISLLALSLPVLLLSLALCGVCAWINMEIAPRCRVAYKKLIPSIVQEKARSLIPEGRFVTDFPGFVVYAERISGSEMEEVIFFQMKSGRKILDVRSPKARLEPVSETGGMRLVFLEARVLQWWPNEESATNSVPGTADADNEGTWQTGTSGDLTVDLTMPPKVLSGGLPSLSDMTLRQLLAEHRELQRLGIEEATPLEVQIHRQVAFSFASFGFALIGIPLGVRAHRRETSVGIAMAIGLVLVYYAFLIVAQALESRPETLPWLIVWMPNLVFQGLGVWMLWRVNRGR